MCNQNSNCGNTDPNNDNSGNSVNVVSLQTAVEVEIQESYNTGVEFSAWSLCQSIRNKVNSGKLTLNDRPAETIGGNVTFNVPTDEVRRICAERFRNNLMTGFSRSYKTNPTNGLTYTVYVPNNPSPVTTPSTVSADPNVVSVAKSDGTNISDPSVKTCFVIQNPNIVSPTPVQATKVDDRVKSYVSSKLSAGINPTFKEIQSSLKVAGILCSDLVVIVKRLGYNVVQTGNGVSQWQTTY